ncbi:PQQ-dependent sugar dehydrogenase [Mangrovimonas sp. AS39]|uniref:PQQ-dependent sugar dehydrogenase n=1 Tax=Mangrovimonas futianensis TaxID=2895523 RepID=UPI001E5A89B4|nr:PQQ-dependent sugar dehydrogenase [Mangrovimonas futianensis]MCF1192616.1 PQQ-dependent sugar dehydrogenase [Mangrovimonas futianensis]MCF1196463.1 PQQ-dependent sugar dehydrogenase [Mangrovimonas futianensis]
MKSHLPSILLLFSLQFLFPQEIELELVSNGFDDPVAIRNAFDDRLFVVEQGGTIQIIQENGIVNTTPFLDISSQISGGGERGLLGLAFHPNYTANGYFFVNYTNSSGDTVISRFTTNEANPDLADLDSENIILTLDQPFTNHNGGDLAFGPDGYLYIANGDGGSGGDPGDRAQDLNELLGKVLRLDIDNGNPYSIPADNPFVGNPNALDEIWAIGLRNPWRFSFDLENGDLWIADVGQNEIEEINNVSSLTPEINYGWRCYEGTSEYNTTGECPNNSEDLTFPIAEYTHTDSGLFKCSITGGYIHRGSEQTGLNGWYFFADYCSGEIGILIEEDGVWNMTFTEPFSGNGWSSFGEDFNGELYIAGKQSGAIYKIIDASLSVDENQLKNLKFFPNPVQNKLNIVFENQTNYISEVRVFNLFGKSIVKTQVSNTTFVEISTEELPSGFYLAEVILNDGSKISKKLIKK